MSSKTIRVATDVGGTFTDLVCFETDIKAGASKIFTAKSDTTPPNFEQGVLNVLTKANIDPETVDFFAHGTTMVINALTERKGVKVGLITTQGFRDTLEIARGNRPDFFNLDYRKPAPFVPRHLRRELPGRMSYRGEELKVFDSAPLKEIVADFKAEGVEAVAICFLHSYANPLHEQLAMSELEKLWPNVSMVSSHQITREWREYERSNTTTLSAYVQPVARRYLKRLEDGLKSTAFNGSLYVMQSNCGVDTLESVSRTPITLVESGPASGFWGAAELGKLVGETNVLALDIGGTTAKCSLIENGQVNVMTDYWIERHRTSAGYPIMVPVVDLVEIGNGGGSIAWVDDFDKLHVGPQSAGALPGPAAYGKGGEEPTTTDANLWLGRINKDYFCGGDVKADMDTAKNALRKLGDKLGMGVSDVARGIVRIANNNMVNALKLVSLNRGYDPRDFTLIAFGGGGAMHAVELGKELGVKKVIVPANASVFSAWGMMMSDLRRDYFVTSIMGLDADAAVAIEALFAETEDQARNQFYSEGVEAYQIKFLRFAKFRYQNQEHTTEVLLGEDPVTAERMAAISASFHEAYEREYTYRLDAPVELVGIHVVASAEVGKMTMSCEPDTGTPASAALKGNRIVDYIDEGRHETSIYNGTKLEPGMTFSGPAIVEDPGTTIVIHPQNTVEVDGYKNIHIIIEN